MPIEKQSLNNFLPDGFETLNQEGYKENFNEDKIKTGYEKDVPDIVSGPNLNNLIDVVGKNTNTLNNYVEYLNGMPINNVPTVNEFNQLDYTNLDDKLTKKQITNCILEIPQRIKYTLKDGTLTIKAGSVFIIPYGVEDKSNQLNIGDVFLHDFYKLYDMQFADGKFFVWVELIEDIIMEMASNVTGQYVLSCGEAIWSQLSKIDYYNADVMLTNIYSSETKPTTVSTRNNHYWYDLTNNVVKTSQDKGLTWVTTNNTLPFMLAHAVDGQTKRVNQVFNGMGYIGSTVWVDKGVKGLIPNGRNEDGTLKNIDWENDKLALNTWTDSRKEHFLAFDVLGTKYNVHVRALNNRIYLNEKFNTWIDKSTGDLYVGQYIYIGEIYIENGVISNFQPQQPIRLALTDMVDGQWHGDKIALESNLQIAQATTWENVKSYDLSSYLPKDGHQYELLVQVNGTTNKTAGNGYDVRAYNPNGTDDYTLFCSKTSAAYGITETGTAFALVGQDRIFKIIYRSWNTSTVNVTIKGYRRLGQNI